MKTRFWAVLNFIFEYVWRQHDVMLGEVETSKSLSRDDGLEHVPGRRRIRGSGVTARRTETGNRAHAFRMTLVSKDKLPQNRSQAQKQTEIQTKKDVSLKTFFLSLPLQKVGNYGTYHNN